MTLCLSQWPRGLRRSSAAVHQLRLWIRIPRGAWMSVCCDHWVWSGRYLCNELITHPEESYRLWCIVVCYLETSWMRKPWLNEGCRAKNKHNTLLQYCNLRSYIFWLYETTIIRLHVSEVNIISSFISLHFWNEPASISPVPPIRLVTLTKASQTIVEKLTQGRRDNGGGQCK